MAEGCENKDWNQEESDHYFKIIDGLFKQLGTDGAVSLKTGSGVFIEKINLGEDEKQKE